MPFPRPFPALLAAPALLLAACSSSDPIQAGGGSTPAELSTAQAEQVATAVINDLVSDEQALTLDGSAPSFLTAPAGGPDFQIAPTSPTSSFGFTGLGWDRCTPAPTVATAGTTTTYTFTNCIASRLVPLESITRNGVLAVTRAVGARTVLYTNFSKAWTRIPLRGPDRGQSITTTEVRNGTHAVSSTGTTLTRTTFGTTTNDPFTTRVTFNDGAVAQVTRSATATFTAASGATIAVNQPLPAGAWNLNTTAQTTLTPAAQGATPRSFATNITTPTPVSYDPTCTTAPQYTAGVLRIVATNAQRGTSTTVSVTFTGCGVYTVTTDRTTA